MYGKEKTGLRRLWDCNKTVFAAAVIALVASIGQLVAAYLFYLPDFAEMKPFTFLMYTVIRWVLLSAPAYLLSAYLEDHYATEENDRFFITAFISTAVIALVLVLNWKGYFQGFLAPTPEALVYSIAMTLLLILPAVCGLCQLKKWNPIIVWIFAVLCAVAMAVLATLSLIRANFPDYVMALAYMLLCAAYGLAFPKILLYRPKSDEEEDTDAPHEAPILKEEY